MQQMFQAVTGVSIGKTGKRRIKKHKGCIFFQSKSRRLRCKQITGAYGTAPGQADRLHVLPDHRKRPPVFFDKGAEPRPAADRLQAHDRRSCEQIEHHVIADTPVIIEE